MLSGILSRSRPGPWRRAMSAPRGGSVQIRFLADGSVQMRRGAFMSPVLTYTADEWAAFLGGVRLGEFDSLAGPPR